ncbi:MAG: O-antigen ligase family protein [Polaribacter sp.]|nr:O-antigen ligase family protein [Polaribacter sp.]
MIEKVVHNRLLFIAIHVVIGFLVTILPFAKIYPLFILIIGIYIIYSSRNKNEEALYLVSYLVGAEVFIRMSDGFLLYETGKYGIILFSLLGIIWGPVKQKTSISFLVYVLFLVIGIVFTQVPLGESLRKSIAFNLSGPISLGFFALYCFKRTITILQLKELLFVCLLPVFSIISFVYFRTPDLEELVFQVSSNFKTSGGFGPNQVATIIGFGVFILSVFIFTRVQLSLSIFLDIIFLLYFTYRGLLTFSRGGMITAIFAFFIFVLFMLLYQKNTFIKVFKFLFITLILFLGIWLYTSDITGGMIDNRYSNKNATGIEKKDISAGRFQLFSAQLENFYESPILGIGVGNGKYKRIESGKRITAASHNEMTRLIEEHGLLGILALLILLVKPLQNIYFSTNYQRAFLLSFYVFWFLTINHSAMRIAFPAFVYGLSLIKIDHE